MRASVVLGFVFSTKPRDWLGEHLRNDLFCVEWDVKLNSFNQSQTCGGWWEKSRSVDDFP